MWSWIYLKASRNTDLLHFQHWDGAVTWNELPWVESDLFLHIQWWVMMTTSVVLMLAELFLLRYVHTVSVRFGISIRFSFRVRRSVHTHQFYSDEPSVFLSVSFILGAKILAFSCSAAGVRQFDHLKHFHRYCRKICWSCVTWHPDSDLCGE